MIRAAFAPAVFAALQYSIIFFGLLPPQPTTKGTRPSMTSTAKLTIAARSVSVIVLASPVVPNTSSADTPPSICMFISRPKALQSTSPRRNGVISAVHTPVKIRFIH